MVKLIPLALIVALACLAVVQTSAQTPEELTPTPEPTKLTEPTPTPTATPIVAEPDEIVFTGELEVPVNTEVTANFYAVWTTDLSNIACAKAPTETTQRPETSRFVLRVPAECAQGNDLRGICWAERSCLVYLADPLFCYPFACEWSRTIHPGGVVQLGLIPIANSDEVVFTGYVPAPPGTEVTIQVFDGRTLDAFTCDSMHSASFDSDISSFVLRVSSSCGPGVSLPRICWGKRLCQLFLSLDPRIDQFVPGTTVAVGLLSNEQFNAPPGSPSAGGHDVPILPGVGAGPVREPQRRVVSSTAVWMLAFLGLAVASAAVITSLRRA